MTAHISVDVVGDLIGGAQLEDLPTEQSGSSTPVNTQVRVCVCVVWVCACVGGCTCVCGVCVRVGGVMGDGCPARIVLHPLTSRRPNRPPPPPLVQVCVVGYN